jgi:hypothetical protein
MSAFGMDTPLSIAPMANPTDTINGGWVLAVSQAGIIGAGEFDSATSTLFHHRAAPRNLYNDYSQSLELLWRFDNTANDVPASQRVSNALTFMRSMADVYLDYRDDSECWLREETEQQNWAAYFQDPTCYATDCVTRDECANTSRGAFDWKSFVDQLNSEAWPHIKRVWTPQGRRWLARVLNVKFAPEQQWRDYLSSSVRYGALRHYFVAEWISSGVGIASPIIRQSSSAYSNWKRTRHGAHFLQSRRKVWVPPLEKGQRGITKMSSEGANSVHFVSETLCTDLTFVHLQPLIENYFLQALGLDDDDMRDRILEVVEGGVATLRSLVQANRGWTSGTRAFFARKLDELLLAVGSPPYRPMGQMNFSRASSDLEELYAAVSDQPETLVQNMLLARRQRIRQMWALSGRSPRASSTFDMPLWEINAFFDPTANSVALLAGILQPPFFSRVIEQPAILYSRMLAIVGHELGHSLDPNGRMADWSGSVVAPGYWDSADRLLDRMAFSATEQCLINLYDGATTKSGNKEDGILTLGENLADHIGLRVGYNTMIAQLGGSAPLSKLQKDFYVGWAQSWCVRLTSAQELEQIESDVHALAQFRIAKPLSDMVEFSQAFQCSSESTMGSRKRKCTFF